MNTAPTLPKRSKGRQSEAAKRAYDEQAAAFCEYLMQMRSRMDFVVSSRGWCYLMEGDGAITKGEFDTAQNFINDMRKAGMLPIDFCSEDAKRRWQCVEDVDDDTPDAYAHVLLSWIKGNIERYQPVSFWSDKDVYIEMLVEKTDLVGLFEPVCDRWFIPIANAGGNADIYQRAEMMKRFKKHEREGRQCVLLYCGDHDPAGLRISDTLMDNLRDLAGAVGWHPDNLIIDRFGLNADFIEAHNLLWIDNLETGSKSHLDDPKHPDHAKPYVQDYLRRFGVRKCEANALIKEQDAGRRLCRNAILKWLKVQDARMTFEMSLEPMRAQLAAEFATAIRSEYGMEGDA